MSVTLNHITLLTKLHITLLAMQCSHTDSHNTSDKAVFTTLIHRTLLTKLSKTFVNTPGQHEQWRFSIPSHSTPCSNVNRLTVLQAIQTLPLPVTRVPHVHHCLCCCCCQYLPRWIPLNTCYCMLFTESTTIIHGASNNVLITYRVTPWRKKCAQLYLSEL